MHHIILLAEHHKFFTMGGVGAFVLCLGGMGRKTVD